MNARITKITGDDDVTAEDLEVVDAPEGAAELAEGAVLIEAANDDDETPGEEDEEEEDLPKEIVVTYDTDEDTGITTVVLSGRYEAEIKQEVIDGTVKYTSTVFKAPQDNLKDALAWVGRNVATRAVSKAWDDAHPTAAAGGRRSAKETKLENQIAIANARAEASELAVKTLTEQAQATNAMLASIMERLSLGDVPLPGSTEAGGVSVLPTISESSASDQTDSQAGTAKRTSTGQAKQKKTA